MSGVVRIPKCTDVYSEGTTLFAYDEGSTVLSTNVGYIRDDPLYLQFGCYKESHVLYDDYFWVFTCESLVTSAGIKVVHPSGVVVGEVDEITNIYEHGYYSVLRSNPPTNSHFQTPATVYDNLASVLAASTFPTPPSPPTPASGVVVTAVATESYPSPTSGVVVTAIARLNDPNVQGGISQPGGGTGTFDDSSYPIPAPSAPTLSPTASGLVTLFRPSVGQITALSEYLWTNLTDFIDNLNKMFVNPMDYLISLSIVPCTPDVGTERAIKIGSFTTTINMPPVLSSWYDFDCGVVEIDEHWGSFLDYSPNTKISLFLPFIGAVPLDVDEVMGRTVGVLYRIDLFSGQCIAMVSVDGSYRYQFMGQCSASIPMTGSDWSRVYSAAIGAGISLASGLAGAGIIGSGMTAVPDRAAMGAIRAKQSSIEAAARAGTAWGDIIRAGYGTKNNKAVRGSAQMLSGIMGELLQQGAGLMESADQAAQVTDRRPQGYAALRVTGAIENAASHIMSAKGGVQRTGSISGCAGLMGIKQAYLLIEYPDQSLPENYAHLYGYPSNIYTSLGSLSGYTSVDQVLLNIPGTDGELEELVTSLKGGVYL